MDSLQFFSTGCAHTRPDQTSTSINQSNHTHPNPKQRERERERETQPSHVSRRANKKQQNSTLPQLPTNPTPYCADIKHASGRKRNQAEIVICSHQQPVCGTCVPGLPMRSGLNASDPCHCDEAIGILVTGARSHTRQ